MVISESLKTHLTQTHVRYYNTTRGHFRAKKILAEVLRMNDKENGDYPEMTNEEYREALRIVFEKINENYKLRWFYRFIKEKLRSSK